MRDLSALEADLLRRYPLRACEVAVAGRTLPLLTVEGSEEIGSSGSDADEPPFWVQIWDAGQGLANYLLRGPTLRGPVLELGAGLGLAGIAAALRGATVVQTDRVEDAVRTAWVNADRCGVADRVLPLVADWRAWPLRQRFPLVLGADILYRTELHAPLLAVLREALRPGGLALLADPGRVSGELFTRRLLTRGWRVTEYPLVMPGRASPGCLVRAAAP